VCEYRCATSPLGRTFVACRCFIATVFFGGMTRWPFFMFCDFLFAFFCFSASFDVPWAMVVGEVFGQAVGQAVRLPLFSCLLAPLRPWLRRVCRICLGISLVFVRQRQRRRRSRSPFRPSLLAPAMSASTHRPSPHSTLPAFPVQRRSRSPPSGSVPSSSHLRRSLSPKGIRLPPIQSLDFAPRPAPREPVPSQPLGTPLQDHYPQ